MKSWREDSGNPSRLMSNIGRVSEVVYKKGTPKSYDAYTFSYFVGSAVNFVFGNGYSQWAGGSSAQGGNASDVPDTNVPPITILMTQKISCHL